METRKLQEVGGGSFTVTIPKDWATSHGFNVGMQLQLYTHRDGSILVRPSDADSNCLDDATIYIDGGPKAVKRAVRTAHTVGFKTITLRRADPFSDAEREAVRSTVRDLVGTNILCESEEEITIGHLLHTPSISVCQLIAQLQDAVVALLRDAIETFADAASTHARVRDRADEARRSVEMITRHFSRSLVSHVSHTELDALDVSRSELFAYYAIARRLETIAEQAVWIANTEKKLSEQPPKKAVADACSVADEVACAVEGAVTAVLDNDITGAQQARDRFDDAIEGIETIEQRVYEGSLSGSVPVAVALANTLSHLRQTVSCGRHMADTAAGVAIRTENINS